MREDRICAAETNRKAPNGFFMNWTGQQKCEGFEYHILAFAIALALIVKGGGKWALDSVIAEKLTENARTR
jgi:uncharacterized membrane protein YphA (DoxX/SURF4 family)